MVSFTMLIFFIFSSQDGRMEASLVAFMGMGTKVDDILEDLYS